MLVPALALAQNIGISNDNSVPDPSAMLDIKSNSRGLLIPRLSTLQRTGIASPAIGLSVFDTDTYSFWVYRGDVMGGWRELLTDLDKKWEQNGSGIYNTNSGNIGIGTNTPQEKLSINSSNPNIQLLQSGSPKGFLSLSGDDLRMGTYNTNTLGRIVFSTQAVDRMTITRTGLVGIGTMNPLSELTLDGFFPAFQVQSSGINIGTLEAANGNDFRLGTNNTNTTGNLVFHTRNTDRVTIDESGRVGIGTGTPGSVLTVNATNPILQLRNDDVDKGFIQLSGDDIKIGANITNTSGKFYVRTNGNDRMVVDNAGRVGIGNLTPSYLLDVTGNSRMTGDLVISGEGSAGSLAVSSANPELSFSETDVPLTNSASIKFEGGVFKIGKTFNGGSIVIDANTNSSTKRFYLGKVNQFNFGTGIFATGYTLSVEGKVIATDFTTLAVGSWPDYVFEKDYALRPLADVKAYIGRHKHLPGIPAAAVMEKEGVQLGDMTKRLLEKVEELTLYILQQQEQIDALKREMAEKR